MWKEGKRASIRPRAPRYILMSLETKEPHTLRQQWPRQAEGKCVQSVNASSTQCGSSDSIHLRLCNRFTHKLRKQDAEAAVCLKGPRIQTFGRKTESGETKGQTSIKGSRTSSRRGHTGFVAQATEKVIPRRGSFAVCCAWQKRLSTTMLSERSSAAAAGQQEFTRKALQRLTVHKM